MPGKVMVHGTVQRTDDDADLAVARQRRTLKMQRYRKRLVEKAELLKANVKAMEAEIDALMQKKRQVCGMTASAASLVPWREVARALEEDAEATRHDNDELKRQCRSNQLVLSTIKAWTTSSFTLMKTPRGHTTTWRNVTLCAHPRSRQLAFDWITRNMLHNTDRMFQQCRFPSPHSTEIVDDFFIDASTDADDGLRYVWRDQREVACSLEYVREMFARPHFYGMLSGSYLNRDRPESDVDAAVVAQDKQLLQTFGGSVRYLHSRMSKTAMVHYLAREFHEPKRCVFVAQSIHQDDLLENDAMQSNNMDWFVLDEIAPNRTKLRVLGISSQCFTKDGVVPLEIEAKKWRFDEAAVVSPTACYERVVHQHIFNRASSNGDSYYKELEEALRRPVDCIAA